MTLRVRGASGFEVLKRWRKLHEELEHADDEDDHLVMLHLRRWATGRCHRALRRAWSSGLRFKYLFSTEEERSRVYLKFRFVGLCRGREMLCA